MHARGLTFGNTATVCIIVRLRATGNGVVAIDGAWTSRVRHVEAQHLLTGSGDTIVDFKTDHPYPSVAFIRHLGTSSTLLM